MRKAGNEKLKILMVAPQPFFRARGTPFSVLHRIRALLDAGHTVDLVTYPFGEDPPLPEGLTIIRSAKPPLINDIKIGPSVSKLVLDLPLYFKTRSVLRNNSYDVLHSHEEAAFFCVGLAKKHKLLHIYDMHSSLPHQLSNFKAYNLGAIRSVFERLENYVLNTCDGVITICDELGEIVNAKKVAAPHSMIENTADDQKVFTKSDDDVTSIHNLHDKKTILYTGTFEPYQGIDLLVPAVARLYKDDPTMRALMVGGRPEQINHYKALAKSLDAEDAFIFVGTVHPSKIPGFVGACDLIVSPRSRGTNTPLKIYGYMRTGKPLVATDLLTHTQTLDETTCCLVPATVEGIVGGIQRVLNQPEYAQELVRNAVSLAERDFSDSGYISKVTNFYDDAVAYHENRRPTNNNSTTITQS